MGEDEDSQLSSSQNEQWIFSLLLPHTDQKLIRLITSRQSTASQRDPVPPSLASNANEAEEFIEETRSLLENNFDGTHDVAQLSTGKRNCCWKYTSPLGMTLQSSILLKLSYRPSWQGIPEYTKKKRRRAIARALRCCRSNKKFQEEQLLEIYTAEHVVKTQTTFVTIRGTGRCQAVQVYLKPLLEETRHDDDLKERIMLAPSRLQAPLALYQERMELERESNDTRFTVDGDSLPRTFSDSQCIVLTFAVPITTEKLYDPPLLWKVTLPPREGIMLDTITVLDGSIELTEQSTHCYIQGYQSWSFTGAIPKGQPQPKAALPNLWSRAFNFGGALPTPPTMVVSGTHRDPYLDDYTPPPEIPNKKKYTSDFFTCITTGRNEVMDEIGGPSLLCGWLSQHEQFGVVAMDDELHTIEMHASHHALMTSTTTHTDWAYAQLIAPHHYDEEPMVHFLHAAASYNEARPLQNGPLLTGWCSWYHYYEDISAANLRNNFVRLASMKLTVPTNVAVVDDGYMTAWGDWDSLKAEKFNDMSIVCRDISSHGMRPGLWLAPFTCDKHSTIARRHPEWIIRNDKGRPANSSNCGKFFYGLDATNPEVREHAFRSVRRAVQDWGFRVLKIDFLYAACLEGNGKYDMSMSRAQAMHLALQTIRDAAGPDVFLIGCGCPIGTGIGYVDGMRVSADTGPTWYPAFPLPWWDHSTLPSLRAMIRNSMSRAPMGHRWWHNDPDCLLLGETTSLSNDEVASAASVVAMTCGMMLLSDDLTKVSLPRMRMLTKIFPMTGVSAVVLDLHTTENKGMPSIMRLWCTDKYNSLEEFRKSPTYQQSVLDEDYNAEATYFGRHSSFSFDEPIPHQNERKRSCISVASGLGTWTVVSLSNWNDYYRWLHIPQLAVESGSETGWGPRRSPSLSSSDVNGDKVGGYHVFSFWSGRYCWIPTKTTEDDSTNRDLISRRMAPHSTEIFHIRPVTRGIPQYVGSDLHFSCGYEVLSFEQGANPNKVRIQLKTDLNRIGHVYLFVPTVDTSHLRVTVAGEPGRWSVFGNTPKEGGPTNCCGRIIRIKVIIHANGSKGDGEISVDF